WYRRAVTPAAYWWRARWPGNSEPLTDYLSFDIIWYQMKRKNLMSSDGWLTLEDTASYLGLGKTRLYELARTGRIPARKIGKKWVFEKATLDSWVQAKRPLDTYFLDLDFAIDGNLNLRDPQRDGYLRTYEFFRSGKNKAIIQLP